jgi:uncharacterized protein YjbI with pentapeptide repeats
MKFTTEEELLYLIDKEVPIINRAFQEINLRSISNDGTISKNIIFENCRFQYLDLSFIVFKNILKFKGCLFEKASFHSMFIKSHFDIENCDFINSLDFSCGDIVSTLVINETTFHEYVDFFDTFFDEKVEISNCNFKHGTNLLAWTGAFKFNPIIYRNTGDLKLDLSS